MPVAQCFLTRLPETDLVARWSRLAGVEAEHMTLQLVKVDAQQGRPYEAMAWLHLPSLWSAEAVDRLQLGLARAEARSLRGDVEAMREAEATRSVRIAERCQNVGPQLA